MAAPTPLILRRLLWVLIPFCVAVAGYCFDASQASGGWYRNRDGEPSYSSPERHSREFYVGLRWSVTVLGGIMGSLALWCRRWIVATVFLATAALFNPFIAVQMRRGAWESFDLAGFWIFLIGPGYLWPKSEARESGGANGHGRSLPCRCARRGGV